MDGSPSSASRGALPGTSGLPLPPLHLPSGNKPLRISASVSTTLTVYAVRAPGAEGTAQLMDRRTASSPETPAYSRVMNLEPLLLPSESIHLHSRVDARASGRDGPADVPATLWAPSLTLLGFLPMLQPAAHAANSLFCLAASLWALGLGELVSRCCSGSYLCCGS